MADFHYQDIDWNRVWQAARKEKSSPSRTAEDWDRKAPSFAIRTAESLYNRSFIEKLQPEPAWTILDVGSGPGTLAIPLARMVRQVSALDFSQKMLEILARRAKEEGLDNIAIHHLAWTDDWQQRGVQPHDIAIASRSLAIDDLRSALEKLTRFATRKVIITDRVGPGPFDELAFAAVGRELKTGPDYIYTINLLYQMGIQAAVDFIRLEETIPCSSEEEAMELYSWMFPDLTGGEEKRLKKYVRSITTTENDGTIILHRSPAPVWAYISWSPVVK